MSARAVAASTSGSEGRGEAGAAVFEVLDALGFAQLVKRSGDLDGSVPLRVAQACAPLFEGNAFGFQVCLRQPLTLRRSASGLAVELAAPYAEALSAGHRAALRQLVARGVISGDGLLSTLFSRHFVRVEAQGAGVWRVRLWTGLLVRADPGVWLRVSATANRRNRFVEVAEEFIRDDGKFTPLILDVTLRSGAPARISLEGELGTVAPVAPGARIEEVSLAEAPDVARSHATFYDAAYFDAKERGPTRKYRKMKPLPDAPHGSAAACCRVITAGPAAHSVTGAIPRIAFTNLVPLEACFDGYQVAMDLDQRALRAGARAVERTFAKALGPTFLGRNRQAMWYFTKYVTPHPPGEPHFFVKPWAFVQTPPGWSCLLEGAHGDGFDVLRGVVATDAFHATPAVFHVFRTGQPIRMGFGEPLLQVMPIPRRLLRATFRHATPGRG